MPRSATLRLTVASGIPSLRPAAEKLPVSTVATTIDIASKRSILILSYFGNQFIKVKGLSKNLHSIKVRASAFCGTTIRHPTPLGAASHSGVNHAYQDPFANSPHSVGCL